MQILLQTICPHVHLELMLLLLQPRGRLTISQNVLLHELVLLRSLIQSFLQVVCDALAFELGLSGLQGWSGSGVEEDVAVLEVLFFWAVLP